MCTVNGICIYLGCLHLFYVIKFNFIYNLFRNWSVVRSVAPTFFSMFHIYYYDYKKILNLYTYICSNVLVWYAFHMYVYITELKYLKKIIVLEALNTNILHK